MRSERCLNRQDCGKIKISHWANISKTARNLMLQTTLGGRYQIINHLGGGGFGQTYLAHDQQLPGNHRCVVKQLKPQANDPATLQTARRLFETEAQVLHKLGKHDHIPQLFAYFEENQEFYLVQEFIEGCDLGVELSKRSPINETEATALLTEILEILAFVHQQNVIHRDINPSNILRSYKDNQLVLIDFGAVKQITTQPANFHGSTCYSVSIGTPGYMPSEQAQGNPKLSSDLYAVGMIAIQALTGLLPHQFQKDPDTEEIIWRNQVSVSDEFANFLDKMVRYDFRDRYPTAVEALQALKNINYPTGVTLPVPGIVTTPPPPVVKKSFFTKKLLLGIVSFTTVGVVLAAGSFFILNIIQSTNAIELVERGKTLYNLKRYEEALSTYQKALNIMPDNVEAWYYQGKTLDELKQYKEALNAYEKAIQIAPEHLDAWMGRSFVLEKLKQYDAAISSFDQVLNLYPNYAEAWQGRGDIFLKIPRYDEAFNSYTKAVELQPNNFQAWYNLGWVLHNLQRYEDAISAYEKTLEIKSDHYKAWYNRGNSYLLLKRYKEAVASYEQAVRLKPDYYQAWYSQGVALTHLNRHEPAVAAFKQVVRRQPNDAEAWYHLGWALHELRRYEEAFDAYDKTVQLQPNNPQAWYNRGNALYNLKRYEPAVISYETAVGLKPDYFEAWYSRGNALAGLNKYEDALASYEKSLQYNPKFEEAKKAQQKLKNQLESAQKKQQQQQSLKKLLPIFNKNDG